MMNLQHNNIFYPTKDLASYRIWSEFVFEVVRTLQVESFGGESSTDSISIVPIMTVPNGFVNNGRIFHSFSSTMRYFSFFILSNKKKHILVKHNNGFVVK